MAPDEPTTDVTVRLRCLACTGHVVVTVATRGRWAAMTNPQRAILDAFVGGHAATQITPHRAPAVMVSE